MALLLLLSAGQSTKLPPRCSLVFSERLKMNLSKADKCSRPKVHPTDGADLWEKASALPLDADSGPQDQLWGEKHLGAKVDSRFFWPSLFSAILLSLYEKQEWPITHGAIKMKIPHNNFLLWLLWLSGLSESKGHQFDSQSRAHAWVTSQVPSRGHARGNHTLMFFSLSFSLPSLL